MPISPKCIAKKSVRSTTLADLYSKSICIQINHKSTLNTGAFVYSGKSKIKRNTQNIYGDDIKNHVSYTNDWCSVLTKGDSLKVTFQKNDTLPRGLSVTVTAGDVFGYFKFIQESQTK